MRPAWAIVIMLCPFSLPASDLALDDFETLDAWQAAASDGVSAAVRSDTGRQGRALRLDFDFSSVAGYAIARRALPLDLPPNFEISFFVRADAPVNNLEFKLIDASGENVWWVNRRDFGFPAEWRQIRMKRRHFEFAWGPASDRTLARAATLELVVSAGRDGGRGSVWFDDLRIRELPVPSGMPPQPTLDATSSLPGAEPGLALDGDRMSAWRSSAAPGRKQVLTVDFGEAREFGGLVLHWLDGAHARRYDVELSDDGTAWHTVRSVRDGDGGADFLYLPESEARLLRLRLEDGPGRNYGLAEIDVKELAFSSSANAFFENVARESPRGHYPRGFRGEQSYWTVVGVDGGRNEGMLSEDGALEVGKAAFSIEPFLVVDGRLVTWADVDTHHSLPDEYLPIPSVTWRHRELSLTVTAFASGTPEASRLIARYDVHNTRDAPRAITLALAIRPFQVNPPVQFLNTPGGVAPIRHFEHTAAAVTVNYDRPVFTLQRPAAFNAAPFDAASLADLVTNRAASQAHGVSDPTGFASGVLRYELTLPAGSTATVGLVVPLDGPAEVPDLHGMSIERWLDDQHEAAASTWRTKLNHVSIRFPPEAARIGNTLRTALAHVLINRDGPALQPGSRSYERSWIRDGALTSAALLRLGHDETVRDFARWYAGHLFANGKVPCCVDRRGADPVPENDSHGEFIFLAAESWRYSRDRALLRALWPRIEAAADYMDSLRRSERGEANRSGDRRAFFGLMPASISHEGYSARPVHSYWDDFWALKGFKDAVEIATALGLRDAATRLAQSRDEFRRDLYASLAAATVMHGIHFLPGSAELGDFDATSTTIALDPAGEAGHLPEELLRATFERYWQEFVARRDGTKAWEDYTPYELRVVGTFVRLGWHARAHELLDFFMASRRPAAWNQWAEVVGRDPRQPRFIGDMPHGWVASDFIRSVLDLFAYERPGDSALVVAAGIPRTWIEGSGVGLENLRTPHGLLSYTLRRDAERVVLRIDEGMTLPAGGIVFVWTGDQAPGPTRINAEQAAWSGRELRINSLPAEVVVESER